MDSNVEAEYCVKMTQIPEEYDKFIQIIIESINNKYNMDLKLAKGDFQNPISSITSYSYFLTTNILPQNYLNISINFKYQNNNIILKTNLFYQRLGPEKSKLISYITGVSSKGNFSKMCEKLKIHLMILRKMKKLI